jgi:superfamily II DNA/RNA helicase
MDILSEYFDGNQEKAVIFSQWERMTRLIAQELDDLGIAYEYLHGGVPSKDRKALFDNFNNSDTCRVFLSTDAGSTGLNLQSASLIINMDIPWNPAVLEQRIGRIHRMGQKSNVSVINFVSTGTIEHRMLGVLKFKSSLAQGILDQGDSAIFLSDSKFNAFMKDIEEMTTSPETETPHVSTADEEIVLETSELKQQEEPQPDTEETFDSIPGDDDVAPIETAEAPSTGNTSADSTSELLTQGFSFLSGLAKTLSSKEETEKLVHTLVEKDEKTGQSHLKIPVESEAAVSNVLNLLGHLFQSAKAGVR